MNVEVLLIIVLFLGCLGLLAWALTLRLRRPQTLVQRVEVPVERAVRIEVPVQVPVERVVTVQAPEPELPLESIEYLAEPQALPDVPDAVHDSVLDGARLGGVVVRGASIRGDLARRDARLRRQTMSIALLSRFNPPVLLSAVAAGHPAGGRSQVGAAQVCRSVQVKLSDRARGLDAAWTAVEAGDAAASEEMTALLSEVTLALKDSLMLAAKGRSQPESALATELTCVLTRLGDMPRRPHLAFGVGAGPVLRVRGGGELEEVFRPTAGPGGPALLPAGHDLLSWQSFATTVGEMVVTCTATTGAFLWRDQVRERVAAQWADGVPPSPTAFLAQLGIAHQAYRDDRTAVGLWDGRTQQR